MNIFYIVSIENASDEDQPAWVAFVVANDSVDALSFVPQGYSATSVENIGVANDHMIRGVFRWFTVW